MASTRLIQCFQDQYSTHSLSACMTSTWLMANLKERIYFLINSHFRRAVGPGGAIMALDDSNISTSSLVQDNVAGGNGGGIASMGRSAVLLKGGSRFLRDISKGSGGGVYAGGSSFIIGNSPAGEVTAFKRFTLGCHLTVTTLHEGANK